MRTIKLHGSLRQFGDEVKLDCDNMFQIMSALRSRFGEDFARQVREGKWHVTDGAVRRGNDLDERTINRKLRGRVLHILPAVQGGSAGLRVIIGVVLFAIGAIYQQPWLMQIGAAMAIGGVAEMLVKPKNMDQTQKLDQAQSSLFNGARNVTTQGGPVPLIYGRVRRASSVVISSDFSSSQIQFDTPTIDYPPVPGAAIP